MDAALEVQKGAQGPRASDKGKPSAIAPTLGNLPPKRGTVRKKENGRRPAEEKVGGASRRAGSSTSRRSKGRTGRLYMGNCKIEKGGGGDRLRRTNPVSCRWLKPREGTRFGCGSVLNRHDANEYLGYISGTERIRRETIIVRGKGRTCRESLSCRTEAPLASLGKHCRTSREKAE